MDDLQPGQSYTFQVQASNQQGWGPYSDESEEIFTATDVAEAPQAPELSRCGIDWIELDARR
jgi:hypothetical protein